MNRTVASVALGGLAVLALAAPALAEELPVNLASPGLVPVAVSDAGATIGGVEPALTARTGSGTVAHYDKQALIRAGQLGAATRRLEASDGSTADVQPNVTLEVKLTRRSARVQEVLDRYGAREIARVVEGVDIDRLADKARARTGRAAPTMEQWHHLTLPPGVDAGAAVADLLALPEVSFAYPAPDAAPPPQDTTTPSFSANQGYLRPAPQGIDGDFALSDPRTRGAGVRIADLEYYWTAGHEDLQLDPVATDLGKTTFVQFPNFADEHGTAVFGEMVGKDNGYGVTGGVPDASMHGISPQRARPTGGLQYVPSAALTYVAQFLSPGDVVLLEQQTVGPNGGTRYVPMEWNQANFDAIKLLGDLGIVVVETGGNGNEDLDSAPMQGRFDRAVRDSGAIVVGAGDAATRTALNFSSHGTRVDLQGWGNQITTTGGNGNLQGGTAAANVLRRYTRSFGGTSGAGPIVTNAVVAVQSYLKATGQGVWNSARLIELLRRTGTPQTGTRLVGPLPNVAAALKEIEVDAPVTSASFSPEGVNGWYLNPTVTLSADDSWGVGVASTEYRLDGGAWTPYTTPFQVLAPNAHTLELRSVDRRGNAESGRVVEFNVYDLETPVAGDAGAVVPATLSLAFGAPASFGAFAPGIDREYSAATTANVISTAGDATLSVTDPSASGRGHLANGAFSLSEPLQAMASSAGGSGPAAFAPLGDSALGLLTYAAPVSNDAVSIAFRQRIGAGHALRTGTYSKTLTFTLSTTTP